MARHWLVDDGLWGLPFGLVGSEAEVGGCMDN